VIAGDYRKEALGVVRISLRGHRKEVAALVCWSLVEAVPGFLSGRLVALAIDRGFLRHHAFVGLGWLAVLAQCVLLGGWATRQLYPRFAALVEPLRDRLVTLAVNASVRRSTVPGAPSDTAGVARVTRQVEIVRDAYSSLLVLVQGFLVTTGSALIGLLSLAPRTFALVLPPLLAGLLIFLASLGPLANRQRRSLLADERISEGTAVMVQGLRDVVASGGTGQFDTAMGEHIEAQAEATRALARLTAVRTFAVALGGLLPIVLVLVAAPALLRGGMSTGTILGVLTYLLTGVHPALQSLVRGLGTNGVWFAVTLGRILEGTEPSDWRHPHELDISRPPVSPLVAPELRFEGVTFSYGPAASPVLLDFDLVVPYGGHLAVVGPSGVGKSTLAGLAAGMLHPCRGSVTVGGSPVEDLDPEELNLARVLIPQEAYVFAGSLWENLTYLRPEAEEHEVRRALEILGASPLVDKLAGDELDPSALSTGERQLLVLVRAYLSPAEIVLLDEATCHLDPLSEARVERAFAGRPGTLVVIAHRMSSARRARRILLMDGANTTLGSHDDLLGRSPLYRDLIGHWNEGQSEANRPVHLQPRLAPAESLSAKTASAAGASAPAAFS
jgi:ATP-binding cassette subfamily C protein